jgi:hypothetical protein
MFETWGEFFLLMGSASGALVGLLFVVTSLAVNMRGSKETLSQGAAFYMTPTLYHYTTVLVISAVATVPGLSGMWMALILGPWALVGAVYSGTISVLLRRNRLPEAGRWVDVWGYGALPGLMYLGLVAAAWLAWRGAETAPRAIAIGLVVLIILGIRNAWDLVTFMAPRSIAPD